MGMRLKRDGAAMEGEEARPMDRAMDDGGVGWEVVRGWRGRGWAAQEGGGEAWAAWKRGEGSFSR